MSIIVLAIIILATAPPLAVALASVVPLDESVLLSCYKEEMLAYDVKDSAHTPGGAFGTRVMMNMAMLTQDVLHRKYVEAKDQGRQDGKWRHRVTNELHDAVWHEKLESISREWPQDYKYKEDMVRLWAINNDMMARRSGDIIAHCLAMAVQILGPYKIRLQIV
jgi:hypothetical protein